MTFKSITEHPEAMDELRNGKFVVVELNGRNEFAGFYAFDTEPPAQHKLAQIGATDGSGLLYPPITSKD